MKHVVPSILVAAALLLPISAMAISADDQAARDAALHWLGLLDTHQYGQAFDAQPARIRTASSREHFIKWMQGRRAPLGRTRKRSFLKVVHTHTLIGAPDGDYQKIGFKTSFERKAQAAEGLVLSKETGHWQVSGYRLY